MNGQKSILEGKDVKTKLTDNYEINTFDHHKFKHKLRQILPTVGYNPDDGFEVSYKGEFANSIAEFNLGIGTLYTTPTFNQNFFGFGNETVNLEIGLGIETSFGFINKNSNAFPTLGIEFKATAGWKANLEKNEQNFAYFSSELQIDYPIIKNKILTLSTPWKRNIISNSNFEFYQVSSVGEKNGLQGYRNERFSGKSSYYQNTDLRINLFKFNAGLVPAKFGIFSGFDYGRVWLDNNNSNKWHSSVGDGIYTNEAGLFTLQTSYFSSDDSGRFMFGLGFGF